MRRISHTNIKDWVHETDLSHKHQVKEHAGKCKWGGQVTLLTLTRPYSLLLTLTHPNHPSHP